MNHDSGPETKEHIAQVARRLKNVITELRDRGWMHDTTKLGAVEKPIFDTVTPKLKGLVYGSDDYRASLKELGPALTHHYAHNTHHPEHYPDGIAGMDLLDLIEMYCDWAAATLRTKDGDMAKGIEINIERFKIAGPLADILRNTWKRHGGFAGYNEEFMGSTPFPTDDHGATWIMDGAATFRRTPKPNAPIEPMHEELMAKIGEMQIA